MHGIEVVTTMAALEQAAAEIARHTVIAVDTETTGLDPQTSRVRLLQIGTPAVTYIIDCFKTQGLAPVADVLTTPRIIKVFHNAKFDLKMLGFHFSITPEPLFDTMLASKLLTLGDTGLKHGLAVVVERYLGEHMSKEEQLSDWAGSLTENQIKYAAEDVRVLLRLYPVLQAALTAKGLEKVAELEFGAVLPTAQLELNGLLLDDVAWRGETAKAGCELLVLQAELDRDLGEKTVNSPAKLREALTRLGLHGLECTDAETLQGRVNDHPVIPKLLRWRKLQKLTTSYGDNLLSMVSPCTGRIHSQYNQLGAVSGRYSCSKPNLQQVPRDDNWRACFTAPPGRTLVIADYSQIELRVLAALSNDGHLRKAYARGLDLHRFTAAMISRKAPSDVTEEERRLAKAINFGITFGMGAGGLSRYAKTAYNVDLDPRKAQGHLDIFFEVFPGVRKWQFRASRSARDSGYILTAMGRRIKLPVKGFWTKSLNYPVQGTAAEGLKLSLIILHKNLSAIDGKLVCIVHDEIVIEVPVDRVPEAQAVLKAAMVEGMKQVVGDIPVELDMRTGSTWAKHPIGEPLVAPAIIPDSSRQPHRCPAVAVSGTCPPKLERKL
jgi:DNA polymerase-1